MNKQNCGKVTKSRLEYRKELFKSYIIIIRFIMQYIIIGDNSKYYITGKPKYVHTHWKTEEITK